MPETGTHNIGFNVTSTDDDRDDDSMGRPQAPEAVHERFAENMQESSTAGDAADSEYEFKQV